MTAAIGKARAAVAAALIGAACGLPAWAQQTAPGPVWTPPPPFVLPPPAYAGTPLIFDPQILAQPSRDRHDGCVPALPCPVQLYGVTGRDGGLMLRGTVLTW